MYFGMQPNSFETNSKAFAASEQSHLACAGVYQTRKILLYLADTA